MKPVKVIRSDIEELAEKLEAKPTEAWANEYRLLGCLFFNPEALIEVQKIVTPSDFFYSPLREIYASILVVPFQGFKASSVHSTWAVMSEKGYAGHSKITDLVCMIETTDNLLIPVTYALKIRELSKTRSLKKLASGITKKGESLSDDDLTEIYRDVTTATDQVGHYDGPEDLGALISGDILESSVAQDDPLYPRTGLIDLDRDADFFSPGTLSVFAGRPGMGKTTFMRHLIKANARTCRSIVYSLEEPKEMIRDKLICLEAGVSYADFRRKQLGEKGISKFTVAMGKVSDNWSVKITDRHLSSEDIAIDARTQAARGFHPRIIFVDHVQAMKHERERGENDAMMFGRSVQSLANLAKELECTVILLCQLNREVEKRETKRPRLGDLRDSGSIEQIGTCVGFIWSAEAADETRHVFVAKQRNGAAFEAEVSFFGAMGRFDNYVKG